MKIAPKSLKSGPGGHPGPSGGPGDPQGGGIPKKTEQPLPPFGPLFHKVSVKISKKAVPGEGVFSVTLFFRFCASFPLQNGWKIDKNRSEIDPESEKNDFR